MQSVPPPPKISFGGPGSSGGVGGGGVWDYGGSAPSFSSSFSAPPATSSASASSSSSHQSPAKKTGQVKATPEQQRYQQGEYSVFQLEICTRTIRYMLNFSRFTSGKSLVDLGACGPLLRCSFSNNMETNYCTAPKFGEKKTFTAATLA